MWNFNLHRMSLSSIIQLKCSINYTLNVYKNISTCSSHDCIASAILSISIKHHHKISIKSSIKILLSINLDISNSWFNFKPFNSIHSVVPRQILDISIAVCRRTVIIVIQNFKVKYVMDALISVLFKAIVIVITMVPWTFHFISCKYCLISDTYRWQQ